MSDERVAISGSEVKPSGEVRRLVAADPNQVIEATFVIRRSAAGNRMAADLTSGSVGARTREEVEKQLAADPAGLQAVVDFARGHGLAVVEESPEKRTVRVRGTIQQMNAAFAIALGYVDGPGGERYLSYNGPLHVPGPISAAIMAVLGLHQEPVARPRTM